MTVRSDVVSALFMRCRAGRPDIEWTEGYLGADPPRDVVWMSDMTGAIDIPVLGTPLTLEDTATITLRAECSTGGLDRMTAMTNVEAYLTDVIRLCAGSPELFDDVPVVISLVPVQMRGPYSLPNPVESGFMALAELDLELESRPQ